MRPKDANSNMIVPQIRDMSLDVVTIRLEDTEVVVYKAWLTGVSPYFKKAFDGSSKEAEEQAITLVDVSERIFRMFLGWTHAHSLQFPTTSAALHHEVLLTPGEIESLGIMPRENKETATVGNWFAVFDEEDFHPRSQDEGAYHDSTAWLHNCTLFSLTIAQLYVFADKYSVPQLRDDILTAFVGQCWRWNWWSNQQTDSKIFIHNNIPASSKFVKFLAYSIAWTGPQSVEKGIAHKLRALQQLSPDLAIEVGIALAEKVDLGALNEESTISVCTADNIPNACPFHDHEVLDQEQCRERIAKRPHVFTAILQACAHDVMRETGSDRG
ncbi:hypothetical protein C7974DRAFT_398048 [Boeremia exigua]|uniref:uncharacterized protein n=1 Tax=Boeremia exigua TaxID=749465 RepID=UPI001E8EE917|nr:uncharacterized protein C7974DRAFT_398048 [Boeremia exigua]KAH6622302.1 hypothetical protein C7974DRAFT_398048 [Boeremia exigua]